MFFATRKIGRIRLIRIGSFGLAFIRLSTPAERVPSRHVPIWIDGAGVRIHLPEVAIHG